MQVDVIIYIIVRVMVEFQNMNIYIYIYIYIYKSNSSGWGSQLSTFCFNVWSLEMFGHFCFLYLAHHGLCQSSCSNAKMLEKELSFFS